MSGDKAGYFLTEAEEAKIPTREELARRFDALSDADKEVFLENVGMDERGMLGKIFSPDELEVFLKGRDAALARIDALSADAQDDDFSKIRDQVWDNGFRTPNFGDVAAYPTRLRIWSSPF